MKISTCRILIILHHPLTLNSYMPNIISTLYNLEENGKKYVVKAKHFSIPGTMFKLVPKEVPGRDWKIRTTTVHTDTGNQIPTVFYRTDTAFSHKPTGR
jgi:hypothetical protein